MTDDLRSAGLRPARWGGPDDHPTAGGTPARYKDKYADRR
jgi:hypothetical protein